MLVCVFYMHFARETAGAARTRLSLRPLLSRRVKDDANLGRIAPRDRGRSSRAGRGARRRSNPAFYFAVTKKAGVLRFARNDGQSCGYLEIKSDTCVKRERGPQLVRRSLRRQPLTPALPERASLVSTPRKGGARERSRLAHRQL